MWLTRASINNPISAIMAMAAILVLGFFSYKKLNIQQFPNLNLPAITIITNYPNASPFAVEHDVTQKIENAINTIGGIDTIVSKSYQGQSVVMVQFDLDSDPNLNEEQVRERVTAIQNDLKELVKTPIIRKFDLDASPIISIGISSSHHDLKYLSNLVENILVKKLTNLKGIGQVNVIGNRSPQITITIDPQKLNHYRLGLNEVISCLQNDTQDFPIGTIKKKRTETMVLLQTNLKHITDFNKLIITQQGNQPIYLHQVATISKGMSPQESAAFIDGSPTIAVDILKSSDANTVKITQEVKNQITALQNEFFNSVNFEIINDNSIEIKASVNSIKETILESIMLTILVVFIFLSSWRSTVIVSLTLPIAIMGTFIALYYLNFSLNNLTLMAISLSIGILIDDAIVIRENISRHLSDNQNHHEAALKGTKEISLAVLATTFTLVAVFLPVAFMSGIMGKIFYQFGITVTVAVLFSLLVSYTIDPMLSSIWVDPHLNFSKQPHWLSQFSRWRDRHLDLLIDYCHSILKYCLSNRLLTLLGAATILGGSFILTTFIGKEFVPNADLGEISVALTTPPGSSLKYTSNKVIQVQQLLKELPDVNLSYTTINSPNFPGLNSALILIKLKPKKLRQLSISQLIPIIRARLEHVAGLEVMVGNNDSFGKLKRSIQVSIHGANLRTLAKIAKQVTAIMKSISGFVDINSGLKETNPIITLNIKHNITNDLGISTATIYNFIQPLLAGKKVGTWLAEDNYNYNIVIQLGNKNRRLIDNLKNLYIPSNEKNNSGNSVMIPLSQIMRIKMINKVGEIDRRNLNREVLVSANVEGISVGEASNTLYKKLSLLKMPHGYGFSREGDSKSMAESAQAATEAMFLAIIFIYLILASQFASFSHPLIIMASLPFSLIGVFITLALTGNTLNIFSTIGCVMLMGIVTKNAILLIDFINVAIKLGYDTTTAILQSVKIRMRPILMTTCAMIFGMLPLSLGLGTGGEQHASMGQTIIGGVITSTILTLIVIPILYSLIEDWKKSIKKQWPIISLQKIYSKIKIGR